MTELPPLINRLLQIQQEEGCVSGEAVAELAASYDLPPAQIYSLLSFFDAIRTRPAGRHKIAVCCGTACYEKGASLILDRLLDELQIEPYQDTSADGEITVEEVYCLGACSRAPLVVVDGETHSRIKSHQVPRLIQQLRRKP